ncbi:MAG: DMT family transporter [Gemmatimonadota bacterium]
MTEPLSRGIRYAALAALSFSIMSALAKLVGARIPVQEIILIRGVLFGGLTLVLLRRKGLNPWGNERPLLALRGLLGYAALSCFFWAVMHLPLGDTTTLHFTNPVFGALLAALVLGEILGKWEAILVVLSLGGVVMVARPQFLFGGGESLPPLAVGVALLGAVFSAAAYVTARRLTRTNDPLVIVFYFALVSVVGSIPFNLVSFTPPVAHEWALLAAVGVATLGGQVFLTRALQLEKAVRVMAVGYLQIVCAALLGAALFAEVPDAWSIAGAVVIIGSTFLMGRMHPVAAPRGR